MLTFLNAKSDAVFHQPQGTVDRRMLFESVLHYSLPTAILNPHPLTPAPCPSMVKVPVIEFLLVRPQYLSNPL